MSRLVSARHPANLASEVLMKRIQAGEYEHIDKRGKFRILKDFSRALGDTKPRVRWKVFFYPIDKGDIVTHSFSKLIDAKNHIITTSGGDK